MALCLDTETGGLLGGGHPVNVVSLWDTRAGSASSFRRADGDTGASHLVRALDACCAWGPAPLVTFNGTGFDFAIMAENLPSAADRGRCAGLALSSYDLMLDFAASHGYMSSLASFASATLGEAKLMGGAEAAAMWGSAAERDAVVEYCEHDAALTGRLWEYGSAYGRLRRHTRAGKVRVWPLGPGGFRPARESLAAAADSPADVSWMEDPPDVASLGSWADAAAAAAE